MIEGSRSASTRRVYASQWKTFVTWCATCGHPPIPGSPEVVAMYVAHRVQEGRSVSSLEQGLAAIKRAHEVVGLPDPTRHVVVAETMSGARRRLRGRKKRQARPLLVKELDLLLAACPEGDPVAERDRCLLLLGFACAMRRSEIAELDIDDVEVVRQGLVVSIRASKINQEGPPEVIPVGAGSRPSRCPIVAWSRWLRVRGEHPGPAFPSALARREDGRLTGEMVEKIIRRRAEDAGLDPLEYSGHSLRAGYATEAAAKGVPMYVIRRTTRHSSDSQLEEYIRRVSMFDGVPTGYVL